MTTAFLVWVGPRCRVRGLANIWRYLEEFDGHKPGRVLREGRPHLVVAVPCANDECRLCLESGEVGDVSFSLATGDGGPRLVAAAWTARGREALSGLPWPRSGSQASAGPACLPPCSSRARGAEHVRRLETEGRLVTLPALPDPPEIRRAISFQEFHVLEASVISNGLCTLCGMCEAVCPATALEQMDGRIRMNGSCVKGECGLCYMSCPQMFWQLQLTRRAEPPELLATDVRTFRGELREGLAELADSLRRAHQDLAWIELEARPGFLAQAAKRARAARQGDAWT